MFYLLPALNYPFNKYLTGIIIFSFPPNMTMDGNRQCMDRVEKNSKHQIKTKPRVTNTKAKTVDQIQTNIWQTEWCFPHMQSNAHTDQLTRHLSLEVPTTCREVQHLRVQHWLYSVQCPMTGWRNSSWQSKIPARAFRKHSCHLPWLLLLSKHKLDQQLSSTEFEVRLHSYREIHPPQKLTLPS